MEEGCRLREGRREGEAKTLRQNDLNEWKIYIRTSAFRALYRTNEILYVLIVFWSSRCGRIRRGGGRNRCSIVERERAVCPALPRLPKMLCAAMDGSGADCTSVRYVPGVPTRPSSGWRRRESRSASIAGRSPSASPLPLADEQGRKVPRGTGGKSVEYILR